MFTRPTDWDSSEITFISQQMETPDPLLDHQEITLLIIWCPALLISIRSADAVQIGGSAANQTHTRNISIRRVYAANAKRTPEHLKSDDSVSFPFFTRRVSRWTQNRTTDSCSIHREPQRLQQTNVCVRNRTLTGCCPPAVQYVKHQAPKDTSATALTHHLVVMKLLHIRNDFVFLIQTSVHICQSNKKSRKRSQLISLLVRSSHWKCRAHCIVGYMNS